MSFYHTINAFNAGIVLLLAFLVLSNPVQKNRKANQWLGAFSCLLFYLFFEEVLDGFGVFDRIPQVELVGQYFLLSLPVLLLMVVRYYVEPDRKWIWTDWFHFSLVGIYFVLSLPVYFVNAKAFEELVEAPSNLLDWVIGIAFFLAFAVQTLYYTYYTYQRLKNHEGHIRQFSAEDQTQNLTWLRHFVIVFLFMFLVFASMEIPAIGQWEDYLEVTYTIGLLAFGYFAVGQPEIFPYSFGEKEAYQELIANEEKTGTAPVPDETLLKEKQRLLRYMDEDRPYLDGQLNLSKLAGQLGISPRLLSQVINACFDENFSSFINRYRTEYAQSLLQNPKVDHLSIYQVGLEAGFHSRTVFHTHFKKVTGLSPSAFRRERRS